MRPRGSYGEVAQALLSAASQLGPAPVRGLAEHAQVGYGAAQYTASRLLSAGALERVSHGRPALVAVPAAPLLVSTRPTRVPRHVRPAPAPGAERDAAVRALNARLVELRSLFWGG